MNRIADITDLVLDDSNSDEDSIKDNGFNSSMEIAHEDVENGRVRNGRRRGRRQDDDANYFGGVLGLSRCRQVVVLWG